MNIKRVFYYMRVSTNEQVVGGGFDRQKFICDTFCATKGWECLRTFREQESGSVETANRPVLSEAISLCGDSFNVNTIIVERTDRIARDLIVAELFFRECKLKGIEVYAADSGEELVNAEADPTRKLIRQVLGALAEWDKAQIVRKLQDGRRRTKEKTGFPCGGPPAFGRKPEETKWVWRILGLHRLGMTDRAIARTLNYSDKFRPEKIKRWANGSVWHIIQTWNHRIEYSHQALRELLDTCEAPVIFTETQINKLKVFYGPLTPQ